MSTAIFERAHQLPVEVVDGFLVPLSVTAPLLFYLC